MSRRARLKPRLNHPAAEAVLLSHMELTRTELLAANVGLRAVARATPRANSLSLANVGRAFSTAPYVTMLGSILVGTLLVGPKRVVPFMLRTGLTGWIARNIRLRFTR
ncbi:hypothetical protein [Paraburkholderia lycopersici]|uniref:Uncharacterized protein n=1 Tax=Paraburkholderia lycopersici TaxID=416944 RepID=A0A1G6TER7_9BURK|nr:hypothetical protein [Paraburkholderia lycopersici]SDD27354.1 hypothetical protein SAMN05421548_11711 [Paraburkholderia lycopersici]